MTEPWNSHEESRLQRGGREFHQWTWVRKRCQREMVSEWKGVFVSLTPRCTCVNINWKRLGGSGLTVLQAKKHFTMSISFDHLFNSHLLSFCCVDGRPFHFDQVIQELNDPGISLVVQWLRRCLPNQGCRFSPWPDYWDPTYHRVWPKININK